MAAAGDHGGPGRPVALDREGGGAGDDVLALDLGAEHAAGAEPDLAAEAEVVADRAAAGDPSVGQAR